MPLEELIHEGWVHGASQWTLLQSWQVANTKVGGIWPHSLDKHKDEFTQGLNSRDLAAEALADHPTQV